MAYKKSGKLCRVVFKGTGRVGIVEQGATIFDAAQKAGVYVNSLCGGDGLCGKCRAVVEQGHVSMRSNTFLADDEVDQGEVIACLSRIDSDITVTIPEDSILAGHPKFDGVSEDELSASYAGKDRFPLKPLCRKSYLELPEPSLSDNISDVDRLFRELKNKENISIARTNLEAVKKLPEILRKSAFTTTATSVFRDVDYEIVDFESADVSSRNYGIACDLGTTTIMMYLVDLNKGRICATAAAYNSQMHYGEDVISRIMYIQENEPGLQELKRLVIEDFNNIIQTLLDQAGIIQENVGYMVCTANTIMIHILLGISPVNIRKEPYIPVMGNPSMLRAKELGVNINDTGYIGFMPSPGAYVGSDITAAVLAAGMADDENINLLIDVGTNGEIVLGSRDWFICCSASAGPAFEGAGTACGMRASTGAIEKVTVAPDGTVQLSIIGGKNSKPSGICGTGFIDLVAELFMSGFLDRTGRLKRNTGLSRIRERDNAFEFLLADRSETKTAKDIFVTEDDIMSLIRTKGAIYSAAEAIIRHVGLGWEDIDKVYISGGFGNLLNIRHSIILGLFPDLDHDKFHFIGNGSITGAKMALLSEDALLYSREIVEKMTYFDLSTDPWFMNEFTSSLFLPHTDLEKFASVKPRVLKERAVSRT